MTLAQRCLSGDRSTRWATSFPQRIYHNTLGGGDVLGLVLAYKMVRVAILIVVAMHMARLFSREAGAPTGKPVKPQGFLLAFMGIAISTSLLLLIEPVAGGIIRNSLIGVSTSLLTIAMAGVGMAMDLRQTMAVGRRLLPVTGLIWLMQLALLLFLTVLLV